MIDHGNYTMSEKCYMMYFEYHDEYITQLLKL